VNNSLGRAVLAVILAVGAARANAQITTVVASPKRNTPSQPEVVRREQVVQDSIARVTLTGMTQWVDSAAAALAIRPDTGAIPASGAAAAPRPDSSSAANSRVTSQPAPGRPPAAPAEFRDGARAPDTATEIPTIALVGGVMVLIGVLVGRRPQGATTRPRR
jgi:hypothetical protein